MHTEGLESWVHVPSRLLPPPRPSGTDLHPHYSSPWAARPAWPPLPCDYCPLHAPCGHTHRGAGSGALAQECHRAWWPCAGSTTARLAAHQRLCLGRASPAPTSDLRPEILADHASAVG